MKEYMY